jgi:hypothetical protein
MRLMIGGSRPDQIYARRDVTLCIKFKIYDKCQQNNVGAFNAH